MEKNNLVSIIVPVYNIAPYIEKCIESIISQSYTNIEIIIVNDGSTDKSGEICDKLANKYKNIYVIHKKNEGLSEARNTGIKIARGQYIVFIDGDDYIENTMIEQLYTRIIEDNSDLAICNLHYVDENGNYIAEREIEMECKVINTKEFWNDYHGKYQIPYVVSWNKIYKKQIFNDICFEKGKIHEDEFILHKVISKCSNISIIEKKLYNYVQRTGSIMNDVYSIKHLQVMDALINRINFFELVNEREYIVLTIKRMRATLAEAYIKMNLSDDNNIKVFNANQNKLKKIIKKYKKDIKFTFKLKWMFFLYFKPIYIILKKNRV